MKPVGRVPLIVLTAASTLADPGVALANPSPWSFEASVGAVLSEVDTSYGSNLLPLPLDGLEASGTISQNLQLAGEEDVAWRVGIRRMYGERNGVQVLYGQTAGQIVGTSSPLEVDLRYTTVQPPDYLPVQVAFNGTTEWSDPQGETRLRYACLNLVRRSRSGESVQFGLSGGLTAFDLEISLASLGSQVFWLGGHGVLFSDIYELSVVSERKGGFGANVGAEIDARLAGRMRAFAEARFHLLSSVDLSLDPDLILNESSVIRPVPAESLGPLESIEIDASFLRVSVGIRVDL